MIRRVNVLGVLLGIAGLLVLLGVGLVLPDTDNIWRILTAEARADAAWADNGSSPTPKEMCHNFARRNPEADIAYLSDLDDDRMLYRYFILEGDPDHESGQRDRQDVKICVGSVREVVSKSPEALLVQYDRVKVRAIEKAPYLSLEKRDPRLEE